MDEQVKHMIKVFFVKEHRHFFNKNYKKKKSDYILNIDKIIKEKFDDVSFSVMNPKQAFLLNYEIKKLLDKSITITNQKYNQIVYINNNITTTSILNIMKFLKSRYDFKDFVFTLIDRDDDLYELAGKDEASDLKITN